jgi:hypothetical protein
MRINLISGPRNISTALMYSFANRGDTSVVDEPLYAHYLNYTGIIHPGREDILDSLPQDLEEAKSMYFYQQLSTEHLFIKGMAHHFLDINLEFLKDFKNLLLIRDPKKLIASFARVIEHPTLQDIGLKIEYEIFNFLAEYDEKPIVIDSGELLKDPPFYIAALCEHLGLPFTDKMLRWDSGPRNEDGVWAKYWYSNVHRSTGFARQESSEKELPEYLYELYEESKFYYDKLFDQAIKSPENASKI